MPSHQHSPHQPVTYCNNGLLTLTSTKTEDDFLHDFISFERKSIGGGLTVSG